MKKLLVTAIGAAAAFGAIAGEITKLRFDEATPGPDKTIADLNAVAGQGAVYWSADQDATNNTYAISATTLDAATPATIDRTPVNGLDIKTTFGKPLSVNLVDGGAATSIGSGLYFDSLVKFTVCEDEPTQEYSGAKIVMWLQEEQNASGDPTGTNLIVRAGYLTKSGNAISTTATNYVCALPSGFNADAWHRVTIKAIADITKDESGVPGFAIYLDESANTVTAGINSPSAKWDGTFELTEAAAFLNRYNALFPTMDRSSGAATTLSTASFDGTGSITDIVFTDEPMAFAADYVVPKANVTIGETTTSYGTLAEAVEVVNGQAQGTDVYFQLSKGMVIDETLAFESPANVVLDFNGCVLTNDSAAAVISNAGILTITNSVGNGGILSDTGVALADDGSGSLTITAGSFWGTVSLDEGGTYSISGGSFKDDTDLELEGCLAEGKSLVLNSETGLYDVVDYVPVVVAEHPWYTSPKAVVLAENLPGQTDNIVSAFHGQGEGEYLGLTYSTNPLQFDLFQVDGLNALTTLKTITAAQQPNAGLRGVAISKKLGIALLCSYYKYGDASKEGVTYVTTNMLAVALSGNSEPVVVTRSDLIAFDSAAFSPDGNYLFSNALSGESSNQYIVKWAVSDGGATLTKVASKAAGGRSRSIAYARINKRDIVFVMADTGKVVVMDVTSDDSSEWSVTDLVTGLPAHSYGTLCVSGVNVVDGNGDPATPHLTVATSTNNGATKIDVLNVYALTVPASGAVTASLTKSFDEDALTAAGFGDISDANRYGNTVYVTDDEATIFFARPDAKLYAGQFAYVVKFVVDGVTNSVPVFPGATVAQADPTKENYIFDGWFLPGAGQAFDLSTPVTQDLTLTAQFTPAKAKVGSALYLTFKEAVEAAPAGATVEVLDDCTEPGMVTITAGITISNNYTVALTGMYALRFANGSTPVTICGTGTLAGSGEGSPLLIGSNETTKDAKYKITTTYEGSVILDGNTITYSGSGNVIKVEYGTFTMNSGTVTAGGNRGVKADADVGNFTSTVIINGGAITSTKAAVAASAGTGTAVATINGGDITGPLTCGQKTGTATLTIPGTSTAKFSAQPAAAYVESGYETVLSDGWYVVQAVAPSGLDPAADVTNVVVTAASPEAAIQTVDVTPPTGSGATAGDYKSLFTYEATPAGDGQYTVAITGIQEAVKEDVSEDAVTSLVTAAEDSTATTVTVDVPAGLYYKVTTYDTIGGTPVDTKTGISSGSGTTPVNKPTSATQGFIKVEIGTKAFN